VYIPVVKFTGKSGVQRLLVLPDQVGVFVRRLFLKEFFKKHAVLRRCADEMKAHGLID
jgi:hypothetical protein